MALNLNSTRLLALPRFILPPLRLLPPKVFFSRTKKLGLRLHCSCGRSMDPPLTVRERIDLSDKEEKIFRRLLDVLDHFKLETQLRVAGGWVRDKLLGKDSYDIDIALDNMLGRDFCGKVNKYLEYIGEEQEGVGVIQCNPDQSKHLETARMRIYDTWIDFVNLRSETYAENSRIPTMEFGTAEQDAYRRDLTINSLFYNINTKSVEDLTGAGIKDLKEGRIATPLPPKETFLDDPLRVLRAIRFGARFDFKLAEDLQQAASDEEVKAAMTDKISRERIGHEIDLMISGNQPVKAMTYIRDLQLFFAVFTLPENPQPEVIEGCDRLCVSYMEAAWKVLQLVDHLNFSDEQHRFYLYGALFLPLRNSIYIDKKSKKIPIVTYIFRNSLKLKANDAEMVVCLHATSQRFISLIPFLESGNDPEILERELEDECVDVPLTSRRRVLAGLVLRQIKDFWRVALLVSTLIYPVADRASDIFIQVERSIVELGLDKVWEVKPLLDGRAIMGILQLKTGGPLVREWQERLLRWQLAHPQGTAEECRDWMAQSQAKRAKLDCCS